MNCREFRERHLTFVDDAMSDADMVAMQSHLAECDDCARHDTALRRGLLVFRNLTPVEPSADFATRLYARLRTLSEPDARAELFRAPGVGAFVAAASVVAFGFLAASMLQWTEMRRDLVLEPVVATSPALPPPVVDYPFVAATSTGMPIWPAAVLAEQASTHFVHAEAHFATFSR
jgi:anti-sigma factor RsiW